MNKFAEHVKKEILKSADNIQDREFKELYLSLINRKMTIKEYRNKIDNMSYEKRMAYYDWLKKENLAIDEMEQVHFLDTVDRAYGINATKKKQVSKMAKIDSKEILKKANATEGSLENVFAIIYKFSEDNVQEYMALKKNNNGNYLLVKSEDLHNNNITSSSYWEVSERFIKQSIANGKMELIYEG